MKKIKETFEYRWPKNDMAMVVLDKEILNEEIYFKLIRGTLVRLIEEIGDKDTWQFLHDLSKEVLGMFESTGHSACSHNWKQTIGGFGDKFEDCSLCGEKRIGV